MKQLPRLPDSVRALNDTEFKRLDQLYPGLPKSLKECPTCNGDLQFNWYENYPDDQTVVTYECSCADQIRLHRFFLHAGLGKNYQQLSWRDIDPDVYELNASAMESVQDYWQNSKYYLAQGMGLMLFGPNGTGKTLLSSVLLKRLLTYGAGLDGYFTTFTGLLDRYAAGWGDNHAMAEWFDRRITYAQILVIDDVGKEHQGRVTMSSNALDNVLRTRVQHNLPTIFTTNMPPDQIKRTYANSTFGLLAEKVQQYEIKGAYGAHGYRDRQRARSLREVKQHIITPIVWE